MEKEVYLSYRKGDDVKKVSPDSKLIPILRADGWLPEGEDGVEALRAEAESLGLKPHHKAGADKLREMIAVHKEVE